MKTTKLLLVVALASVGALTACGNSGTATSATKTETPATQTPATETPATETPKTETPSEQPAEEVKPHTDAKYDEASFAKSGYTLNDYMSSTTSLQWNPLTWETSDDSAVLGYISSYLWDYQINEAGDGYEIVPELATGEAQDVTSEYVGKFGVEAGESKKAWRISLNPDACWDDGDYITADDYIYTMQQQLDPVQLNRRADSFYGGSFAIVNAKNYLYSGTSAYTKLGSTNYSTVEAAVAAGETVYIDAWNWYGAKGYEDGKGNQCPQYIEITDETEWNDYDETSEYYMNDAFTGKGLYDYYFVSTSSYASYASTYCFIKESIPETSWDQVGFLKVDDYTIDIITEGEMEDPTSFYLPYEFSSIGLVQKKTYEKAWVENDAGETVNMYGLELEYTRSYGPYKLSYFEDGKQVKFTRNENWWGYKTGAVNGAEAHQNQYQTTDIVWDVIANHSSALLAFESGQIDSIGLESADLDKYGSSKYLVYEPQSYTTKVTFNTDLDSLKAMEAEKADGKNREIQTILEFREALSYCIDRQAFVNQFSPAAAAGYGMFNYMYQVFLEDGTTDAYRNSDEAKKALLDLYGIKYGEGETYETLSEAYQAITGYDMSKATALLNEAYTKAIAAGVYTDGQPIDIQFNMYSDDAIYVNMIAYFNTQIQAASVGTPFEDLITFTMFVDDDYYNTMYAGDAQFIYTTWGGATYGVYGMMASCYCDSSDGSGNQMEYGFDTSSVPVTIEVDGKEYTYSLQAWAYWMNNDYTNGGDQIQSVLGKRDDYDVDTKNAILAALEYEYLSTYVTIPMYYRQSAVLVSKKISYGSKTYLDMVGFGGVREMTYNYSDAEWAEFIKDSSNLQY